MDYACDLKTFNCRIKYEHVNNLTANYHLWSITVCKSL